MPGHNLVRITGIILGVALLSSCASNRSAEPGNRNDMCRIGSTLVCEERVGQVTRCTCKSKDSMRDILEPEPY